MIYEIFAIFLILTFTLIILGFYKNYSELQMVGFAFLFLISVSFMVNGLDYKTGANQTMNSTITPIGGNYTLVDFHSTMEYQRDTYDNHTIGFFLCIVAVVGFIEVFFNMRKSKHD